MISAIFLVWVSVGSPHFSYVFDRKGSMFDKFLRVYHEEKVSVMKNKLNAIYIFIMIYDILICSSNFIVRDIKS